MSKIKDEVYDPFLPTLLISLHQEYVKEILTGQKVFKPLSILLAVLAAFNYLLSVPR